MKTASNRAILLMAMLLPLTAARPALAAPPGQQLSTVPAAPAEADATEYQFVERDLRIRNQADPDRLSEDFDDGAVLVEHARPTPGRFQAMIQAKDSGLVPSHHFISMAPTLKLMNRLAYDRGRDQVHGHELMYTQTLKGWELRNFSGIRGRVAEDRNAGFVAYHKALNTMVVCFHGSIANSDWVTNLHSFSQRFDSVGNSPETLAGSGDLGDFELVDAPLVGVGRGQAGFIHKAESCRKQISAHVAGFMAGLSHEEKGNTKFIVTGHSQGAALGMIEVVWLCEDLKRHYGREFSNARSNRVYAWLLATPRTLDRTAVAYANGFVGKRNILVQNTSLDPVGLASVNDRFESFLHAGTLATQSSMAALAQSFRLKCDAVTDALKSGHYTTVGGMAKAAYAMVQGASMAASLPVAIIAPLHMGSDAATPGLLLADQGFDPAMVSSTVGDIVWALNNAANLEQAELQRGSGTMSLSQRVWSYLGY